jgi:anti-anti-sigma factor
MAEPQYQYVTKRLDQDVLVVTITTTELSGDEWIDAMRQELLEAVAPSVTRKVALDFKNVTYIASPGIRLLLGFRRHFQDMGGRLILCSLNSLIADVLNTARLIGPAGSSPPPLFETAPDVPAGIARLNAK